MSLCNSRKDQVALGGQAVSIRLRRSAGDIKELSNRERRGIERLGKHVSVRVHNEYEDCDHLRTRRKNPSLQAGYGTQAKGEEKLKSLKSGRER